ncbi:MAG TPA: hypothetical protein VMJ11_24120 [Paraburkholderia sp.]|uniref:hypothetical protein n=1 Tax=Paraburkholderia sp. TaxID=1926495 RepID=UPI002B8868FF|nr:hypothetical protein [Paraburkholderia sp.]HTR09685.1 hypothetical protein [Paraburkholderia sp.]
MNLQDQIGVLEAGVDQLIKAAAAAQALLADERAAAEPCQVSPVAAGEVQTVEAQTIDADIAAVAHVAAAPVAAEQPQVEATEVVEAAETIETAESVNAVEIAEPAAVEAARPEQAQPELLVARPSQNEITLTVGGQTVTLNALQVGQMIEELSNARASMQPEPPPGIPPGWRFASTKNPMMAVQKQSNGDRLLVLRHTGHGWVPFTFSPDIVVQMYMLLTQR